MIFRLSDKRLLNAIEQISFSGTLTSTLYINIACQQSLLDTSHCKLSNGDSMHVLFA
jgi:hypothetical protein